jgi:hypothetical protein
MLRLIFNFLSIRQKARFIQRFGSFVGSRVRENKIINLYMMDSFFVEVIYTSDNSGQVEDIRSYQSLVKLKTYLSQEFNKSLAEVA